MCHFIKKNPNRSRLDSIFHAELKRKRIKATGMICCTYKKQSTYSSSDTLLREEAIPLAPIIYRFDENPDHYYMAERPRAYKRTGDTKIYNGKEIEIITDGIYRSLHYIVKYKGHYIEIQGRTLFEEGWGEVDHDIVYKDAEDNEMLRDYSRLLNRLSGLADEMSSYFRRMKHERECED